LGDGTKLSYRYGDVLVIVVDLKYVWIVPTLLPEVARKHPQESASGIELSVTGFVILMAVITLLPSQACHSHYARADVLGSLSSFNGTSATAARMDSRILDKGVMHRLLWNLSWQVSTNGSLHGWQEDNLQHQCPVITHIHVSR
jgi:hypothetical protein